MISKMELSSRFRNQMSRQIPALVLGLCVAFSAKADIIGFAAQQTFATGNGPVSVTAADVNGDGKPDLVVANENDSAVSVLLNLTASGATTPSFAAQLTFMTGIGPNSVTSADLNGDGKPDLVVVNYGYNAGNTVSVMINTTVPGATTSSFAAQQTFATGLGPYCVITADINGDGKPDLIVANQTDNNVSVLLNTTAPGAATPSFAVQQTFATGNGPSQVTFADVNGDGKPDLIVANNNDSTVSVLVNTTARGAATSSFAAQQTFATGNGPVSVTAADVNGDGKPDLVVANENDSAVSVLLNLTASGATTPSFAPKQSFATGGGPISVTAIDVNGDAKLDLVVANEFDSTVSVMINNAAPGATTPSFAAQPTYATGRVPDSITTADLNGDGKPDLIVANYRDNTVSVLLGGANVAVIPASERAALIALFNSTGGSGWTDSTGWNGPVGFECRWYGVSCDDIGSHVTDIGLDYNNLAGQLPSLTELPSLKTFSASGNHLTGPIPPLNGLTSLQEFAACCNKLTGQIPALTGLPLLTDFAVFDNRLTGSIPSLTGLIPLKYFNAEFNQLTGSIPSLTGLTSLTDFSVRSNQLTGPIPALTGLTSLQFFFVDTNQLTGQIPALTGMTSLGYFYTYSNQLTGPIPALTGLTSLVDFIVGDNQLSGPIPALTGLTSLYNFFADNNQLSGSIPALTGLSLLSNFIVDHNQLTGSIPALTALHMGYFGVDNNQLTGQIPALSQMTLLSYFYADHNELTGSIPELPNSLNYFDVEFNNLTGTIPSLSQKYGLFIFRVGGNQLSGDIAGVPVPADTPPDTLFPGLSNLCPNKLTFTPSASWDRATGLVPWYSTCATAASEKTASAAPTTNDSTHIGMSEDGTIMVFQSQQTDLTSNTANAGGQDVYSVGPNGQTVLESLDASGNKLIGMASLPAISSDGKVVAFLFTPAAAKQAKDAITGEMFAGLTGQPKHQVDIGMGGVPPNGSANAGPSLSSANGINQLAFCSSASNLVPGDGNNGRDVFLVDPLIPAAGTQRVSVDSSGKELPGDSCEPKLSIDGNKVVFSLSAPTLYSTPARQIVVKDLAASGKVLLAGQMLPITTSPTGHGATADSSEPTINQDGSVVVFTSQANLDGLGTPIGSREVFVSLLQSSGSRLIQRMRSGDGTVPDGASQHPQVSGDGTTVVLQTAATNFLQPKSLAKTTGAAAPQACGAVAITTNFFSVTSLGSTLCTSSGTTNNQNPSISGDGSTTGFDSNAPLPGTTSSNTNAYSQGIGVYKGVTGAAITNLSGDFSGQWLDPNQSGQGLVIDVTNPDTNNRRLMLLTWFVFSGGQPTWVQGVGVPRAGTGLAANSVVVQMDQVAIFQGSSFPLGEAKATASLWGSITLTFTDANTGNMSWNTSYSGFTSGSMPIKHFLPVALPKSDAPGAKITSCYSGNWFNPAQVGDGFEFEVLSTNPPILATDWFAFAPNGAPVWLYGSGPISGNSVQMHLVLIDGAGAQFPPNYNPNAITQHDWGTATFTFTDASHGSVTWNSTIAGYGSGTQPLQPLAKGLMDRRGCQ